MSCVRIFPGPALQSFGHTSQCNHSPSLPTAPRAAALYVPQPESRPLPFAQSSDSNTAAVVCPYFHQPSRGVDQLRPHRYQGVPGSQHHQILAHFSTAMPNRIQRLRIHPPQARQLVGIDAIALPLATLRPFHQPRVGHPYLVSPLGDHVLHPSRVSSYFDHYPRRGQCLGRTPLHLPALSATVLRPAFLPSSPKCSTDSSGLPDPLPPSDDLNWGPIGR